MALTSREFQYLCLGCFLVTQACAIITSSGTIEINTAVDITCINQPYTGTHIWKFNTAEVLICGFTNCEANASNPTRFSFENDRGNGVFVFTINPVARLDDESIIGCHNGSVEDTLKLEVKDSADPQIITSDGLSAGTIAGITLTSIFGFALVLCCCAYILASPKKFTFHENENNDKEPYVSWIPGCCGKCPGTFILKVEKEQGGGTYDKYNNTENTTGIVPYSKQCKKLDVECYRQFYIDAKNGTGEICEPIKDIEPSTRYKMTLCAKIKRFPLKTKELNFRTCDKPDPPKDFMFNENISSYELPYVSWVPGFDGGCPQTFFLQFQTPNQTNTRRGKPMNYKENVHVQEIMNTTAPELNKPIDEGHSEVLDLKSKKEFTIQSDNSTTIFKKVKGLDPSSQYEIKLYGKNKYGDSEVKTLHEKTHDKPDPPKDFMFNENINSFELPYVSWVPGFNGGCPQTFILQFETPIQTNTRRGKPIFYEEKKHDSETLDVESNKMFSIPSHNETTIHRQIKGLEPLSQYNIKLYGKNKYGESEVKTLHELTHGEPDPPKKIQINMNPKKDGITYMSWVPGFNGGCLQLFLIRFEIIKRFSETKIKTLKQTDIAEGTAIPYKKVEFVEGHHVTLYVNWNNSFAITSPKEATKILLKIKGMKPSSSYFITLCGNNRYGQSEVIKIFTIPKCMFQFLFKKRSETQHKFTEYQCFDLI